MENFKPATEEEKHRLGNALIKNPDRIDALILAMYNLYGYPLKYGPGIISQIEQERFMTSLADLDVKSTEEDPIADTKKRIREFWEKEDKPNLERCDSSIKINGKEYQILIFVENKELTVIIK